MTAVLRNRSAAGALALAVAACFFLFGACDPIAAAQPAGAGLYTLSVVEGPADILAGQQGQAKPVQPGQTSPAGQTPAAGQPGKASDTAPAAPAVNKEEEDAYKMFHEAKADDVPKLAAMGEEFLKKFPESRYREGVHSKLATAYMMSQQLDKMYSSAEKAIELNPENVDMLALMAMTLPRSVRPNDLDSEQKLLKAEKYSRKAIELLGAMVKPAHLTDEDFAKARNEKLAMCHSGLGMVSMHRGQFPDMVAEYEQATKLSAGDPADFFMLGFAYERVKRFADSAAAYARCAEVPWGWQDRCKQSAEAARKQAAAAPAPAAPKP